jgi:hypothetical protein
MPRTFSYTTEVFDEYTDFPQTGDVDTIYIDASKNKAYRYDQSYYPISSEGVDIWGAIGSLSKGGGGGGGGASWGSINGTLSNQTDLNTALSAKQDTLTLTTTGTSGAATLVNSTLNIPQYSGGGIFGTHIVVKPQASVYYSSNPFTGSGGTTSTLANNIYLAPFIPKNSISVNEFRVEVNTIAVGGLARILLFDDLNGLPKNKIIESTNLDCSTSGMKTFTASFSFVAGTTYWLGVSVNANIGFRSNNTSFALQHHASSSAVNPQYQQAQTFGSLPSSITISPNSNAFSGQPITIRFRAV